MYQKYLILLFLVSTKHVVLGQEVERFFAGQAHVVQVLHNNPLLTVGTPYVDVRSTRVYRASRDCAYCGEINELIINPASTDRPYIFHCDADVHEERCISRYLASRSSADLK